MNRVHNGLLEFIKAVDLMRTLQRIAELGETQDDRTARLASEVLVDETLKEWRALILAPATKPEGRT